MIYSCCNTYRLFRSRSLLFLIDESCRQCPDAWQNLNGELVAIAEILLRCEAVAHTRRGTCQDEGPGFQRRSLREETDDLGDREDKVALLGVSIGHIHKLHQWPTLGSFGMGMGDTYSAPQSCKTRPFFRPRTRSLPTSYALLDINTGPMFPVSRNPKLTQET